MAIQLPTWLSSKPASKYRSFESLELHRSPRWIGVLFVSNSKDVHTHRYHGLTFCSLCGRKQPGSGVTLTHEGGNVADQDGSLFGPTGKTSQGYKVKVGSMQDFVESSTCYSGLRNLVEAVMTHLAQSKKQSWLCHLGETCDI